MANEIIYTVKLDTSDSEKKTVDLTKAINNLTAAQKANKQTTDEEIIAYEKNAQELKSLKSERDAHRKALEADQKASKANQTQIEGEIKAYNSSGKSLNENRRALADQKKAYADLKNPSKEATESLKRLNDRVKEQESAFGDNQRKVGSYSDLLKGDFKGAASAASNSISGLSKTMLANPVGLLVTGFLALKEILLANDEIATEFEARLAQLKAVAETLFNVFRTGNFKDFTENLKANTAAAYDNVKAADALDQAQTDLLTVNEKLSASIDLQEKIFKNKANTDKERADAVKNANTLDQERFENNKKIAEQELKLAQDRFDLEKRQGNLSDETQRNLAEAKSKIIALEGERAALEERNSGRFQILAEQRQEKEEKAAEQERKRMEQRQKDNEKILEEQQKQADKIFKMAEDAYNKQVALDEKAFQDRIKLDELELQNQAIKLQAEQDALVGDAEIRGEISDGLYEKLKENIAEQARIEEEQRLLRIEAAKGDAVTIAQINNDSALKLADIAKKGTDNIIKLTKQEQSVKQQATNAYLMSATTAIETVKTLTAEQGDAFKALSIAQGTISTIQGILSVLAAPSLIPEPAGSIAKAVSATAIGVAGALNVAKIAGVKFADGGIVNGASHENGGVKFALGGKVLELEGGEAVINKRSTAMFRGTLSQINHSGGGVKFADGGLVGSNLNSQVRAKIQPDFENILKRLPQPVVSVVDIENVSSQRAEVIDTSTL